MSCQTNLSGLTKKGVVVSFNIVNESVISRARLSRTCKHLIAADPVSPSVVRDNVLSSSWAQRTLTLPMTVVSNSKSKIYIWGENRCEETKKGIRRDLLSSPRSKFRRERASIHATTCKESREPRGGLGGLIAGTQLCCGVWSVTR